MIGIFNMYQLPNPLPVYIPSKNETGIAHFVINPGIESHLQWVVFLDKDGSCWTVQNPDIRIGWNVTLGRVPAVDENVCKTAYQASLDGCYHPKQC